MTLTELLFYIDYIDYERYCEEYIDIPDKKCDAILLTQT